MPPSACAYVPAATCNKPSERAESRKGKASLTSVVVWCVSPLVKLSLACHGVKRVRGASCRNVFGIVLHAASCIHDLCGGAWHGSLDYGTACVALRYVGCAWHAPRILIAVALLRDESGPVTMTPLTLNDGGISSRFHGAAHGTREIPRNGVRLADSSAHLQRLTRKCRS